MAFFRREDFEWSIYDPIRIALGIGGGIVCYYMTLDITGSPTFSIIAAVELVIEYGIWTYPPITRWIFERLGLVDE